jgi:hypothetical protein
MTVSRLRNGIFGMDWGRTRIGTRGSGILRWHRRCRKIIGMVSAKDIRRCSMVEVGRDTKTGLKSAVAFHF